MEIFFALIKMLAGCCDIGVKLFQSGVLDWNYGKISIRQIWIASQANDVKWTLCKLIFILPYVHKM